MSRSRTQHGASSKPRTRKPSIPSITLYHCANALLIGVLLNCPFQVSSLQYNLGKTATQIDKTNILMTNGSLMKVKRIAECSSWIILQYFWPELNDNYTPANFVCGGVYCFHVVRASVRPCVCGGVYCFHVVRASVRPSVRP